jgi:hypothetical protein
MRFTFNVHRHGGYRLPLSAKALGFDLCTVDDTRWDDPDRDRLTGGSGVMPVLFPT